MIAAEIDGIRVIYKGAGRWQCNDPLLVETLKTFEAAYWSRPARHEPDQGRAILEYIISEIGGRIVSEEPAAPAPSDAVFYSSPLGI